MKTRIIFPLLILLASTSAKAQWITKDIAALLQRIDHFTAQTRQMTDLINQGEKMQKWYEGLERASEVVIKYRKTVQSVQMAQDIAKTYAGDIAKIRADQNFTTDEIIEMTEGYKKLIQESADLLKDLKLATGISGLKLSDKERLDMINDTYEKLKRNKALLDYYTRKNLSVSIIREKKKKEKEALFKLYGIKP